MALIEVDNLSKVFASGEARIQALDGVSLRIEEGEFAAITGPSGSGKSTLMYILGLLDRPSTGRYLLGDRDISAFSDDERARIRNQMIGFVFQSFHLLPRASALRNVAMPLIYASGHGRRVAQRQIMDAAREALEAVSLGERLAHRPNQLSGGQCQRVAIARAIVNKPAILFADEPTGNLDSRHGQEILDIFSGLNRQGVTVVIVTHDASVAAVARRRLRMHDGRICEDDYADRRDITPVV